MEILETSNLSPLVNLLRDEIFDTNEYEFIKNENAFKKVDSFPYEEGCIEGFFIILRNNYGQNYPDFVITTVIDDFDHIAMNLNTDSGTDYENIMCHEFEIGKRTLIHGLSFDFSDLFLINSDGKWIVQIDRYEDTCALYESN